MPDASVAQWSDPRFLQNRIRKLEHDLALLKKQTLPFAANQRGAIPGAMRAVSINDQGLKGSMWSNFNNSGPGLGPYTAITDTVGVIRAELGNLAANGISPAQYGFRANDATGTPIFDSLGLINVMSVAGSFTDNNADTVTSTTPVVVGGVVSVTFSLARQSRLLALCWSTARLAGAAGAFASGTIFRDGTSASTTALWDKGNVGYIQTTASQFYTLAAGSHTLDYRVSVDNAALTWTNFQTTLDVFLLGT